MSEVISPSVESSGYGEMRSEDIEQGIASSGYGEMR